MKQLMTICIASIMMLSFTIPVFATDAPILDFNFRQGEGTTITDSASGIVATTHGTVWSTDPSGRPVLYFDNAIKYWFGDGDYVEIPYHNALNSPHITVESWVYPMSTGYYTVFAERILDYKTYQMSIFLGLLTTGYHEGTQPEFLLDYDYNGNGDYLGEAISPYGITLNEWHQIVGTYDGSDTKLYIDGELVATTSADSPRSTGSNPLYLGHAPTSNHYFNGYYARFRMYDRALSDAEVAYNFINGPDGTADSDSDGDGVPDDVDAFPDDPTESADWDGDGVGDNADVYDDSDLRQTVAVADCETGVMNLVDDDGLSIQDYINNIDGGDHRNHGEYVSTIAHFVQNLLDIGVITQQEAAIMVSCAARSDIGKKPIDNNKGGKKK